MTWDEWEQIKRAAAQHNDGRMQLNQLPADTGTGPSSSSVTGGLTSNKQVWNKAAADIGGLRTDLRKSLTQLQDGQKGLCEADGCLTSEAQKAVHESWTRYVGDLDKRCGGIDDVLRRIGHDLLMTDEAVRSAFGAVTTQFGDTPGLGGQDSGR